MLPLRSFEGPKFELATCNLGEADCATQLAFSKQARLKLFRGAPATVPGVLAAINSVM